MYETLSRADLIAAWEKTNGRPPPKGLSTRILELSAAYHQQACELGGLKPETRERLLTIARGDISSTPATVSQTSRIGACQPGTRLIREWHREVHIVDVLEDGVLYRGTAYPSLSAAARHITGARWSGPRFFGAKT